MSNFDVLSQTTTSGAQLLEVPYQQFYEADAVSLGVVINGQSYRAAEVTFTENAHGATDTATVTIPLSSNPDLTVELFRGDYFTSSGSVKAVTPVNDPGTTYAFSDNSPVYIQIRAGLTQNSAISQADIKTLPLQFLGTIDLYSAAFAEDTVKLECRSLGAPLVDDTMTGTVAGWTIAYFIQQMATRYALPPPVINLAPGANATTVQQVLAYDQVVGSNFTALLHGMHPWDLILRGASFDDTDAWVDIRTGAIHYESPKTFDKTRKTIDLQYGRDWISLNASHAPQFSKNVQVNVHSYQPRTRASTTVRIQNDEFGNVTQSRSSKFVTSEAILGTNQTIIENTSTNPQGVTSSSTSYVNATTTGGRFSVSAKRGVAETGKQKYTLYVGNLSPDAAAIKAQAYWRQISQMEYSIDGEVPMTQRLLSTLSITALIQLSGAPWSLVNNTYYPRELKHSISVENGWTVGVKALSMRLANGAV